MQDTQYKVVFSGEIMPGMTLDAVKDNLALLFKSDRSRIDGLFGKGPVALKRELREDEAEKYLGALQRAGAQAHKEIDFAASLTLVDSESAETAEAAQLQTMECPKCGHGQPKAIECSACGIVIEKYLARQALLKERAQAEALTPTVVPSPSDGSSDSPHGGPQEDSSLQGNEIKPLTIKDRIGRLLSLLPGR
ncbi:hypothetical protein [Stutzerimonas azotifigens]|uniref:Zinc ribbon domain-containing protein n=1 Tax=Stutzerimonas azotifigens TaxID=291995 RepID=A0ABR5YZR6_9GAMM|nr:hypothetical protein [Stutzerimonas azotifigens]MBA1273411.1 hypothetical protein [Stutzerimonas azotifigens]